MSLLLYFLQKYEEKLIVPNLFIIFAQKISVWQTDTINFGK